jgi:hypothetical protein
MIHTASLLRRLPALLAFALAAPALPAAASAIDPVLLQRGTRIVAALDLSDAAKAARVSELVARHYANLRPIHDERDVAIAAAKAPGAHPDSAARDAAIEAARDRALGRQAAVQYAFTGALAAELNADQVNAIKDGLTYGVMPNTYKVYLEMLPDLDDTQRAKIYGWLYEAREYAMNAGSSEEKHGWFGKYKGRINNYLSTFNIDMKAAEKAMFERRKAAGAADEDRR